MNIIFTRPLIDSEDLMMNFFSSGHKVIHMPTLSIASANMEPINTKDYDGLIFTSANAVRFLKLKNDDKNIKCFCVGNLTERSLRLKGFNNTIAASGTVNALKNIIINSEKNVKNLAYLCGDVISYELDKELKQEGLKVSKIINYISTKITEPSGIEMGPSGNCRSSQIVLNSAIAISYSCCQRIINNSGFACRL